MDGCDRLRGQVALVTGGGTGIGRATSLVLAGRGVAVAVNYSRSEDEAKEVVRTITTSGGRAITARADVSKDQEVRAMVEQIAAELGSPGLLVNNASVTRLIPLADLEALTEEVWDTILAVNVKGMFYGARAVAPYMKALGRGAIVNVGSTAGPTGNGSSLPYAVSKAAVEGLTRSLAHALAPEVRVCCIAPGVVATRWWAGHEERVERLRTEALLRRTTTPEDVAELISTLLVQEAVTGQTLIVDGGQTL